MKQKLISDLKDGFILSCQALPNEPLYGSRNMAAMAVAAEEGGAAAIRANTPEDIREMKRKCSLPIIGLFKKHYEDSAIYITPTMDEVTEIVEAGANFVAVDCTRLPRPGNQSLDDLISQIRTTFPQIPIVADVSIYEEGVNAISLGVDLVSTTMSGYTPHSPQQDAPDIELVRKLARLGKVPVLAEGRLWNIEQCLNSFDVGAYAVVVGTAITRPQEIVKRYVQNIRRVAVTKY
ncbi:N-acetylmannosamine-6-phosphate 2-epimerase [Bacillus sp. FJAT-28004]|uniref:N-acetylmannosamine-6-phosphate 2-epimerase n=1 Tax=Bacillus sp. FJAT-28004 TaxID=1679165 RepID=UPI0006B447C5|nr:N-acetylmannosamine-6-phosphate 2-epimerase [Bacillus sp. FJAT-28004]